MSEAFLLLGGNIGDRFYYLEEAETFINKEIGDVVRRSSYYETEPWGFEHENDFLNRVLVIKTALSPTELLFATQNIEKKLGRKKNFVPMKVISGEESRSYAARTVDIDILFYENITMDLPFLSVPHKELHNRKFTLLPLMELAPGKIHPLLGKRIEELTKVCTDHSEVKKVEAVSVFAKRV